MTSSSGPYIVRVRVRVLRRPGHALYDPIRAHLQRIVALGTIIVIWHTDHLAHLYLIGRRGRDALDVPVRWTLIGIRKLFSVGADTTISILRGALSVVSSIFGSPASLFMAVDPAMLQPIHIVHRQHLIIGSRIIFLTNRYIPPWIHGARVTLVAVSLVKPDSLSVLVPFGAFDHLNATSLLPSVTIAWLAVMWSCRTYATSLLPSVTIAWVRHATSL